MITDLLNSGYSEVDRYHIASGVVRLLGKWFDSLDDRSFPYSWTPALLGFLSLCEKFYAKESPPHTGRIALRILSACQGYTGFGATTLPVLTSMLLPTHPLQSRTLALNIFRRFVPRWSPPQTETIPTKDFGDLLQAVGDPFFVPDGQYMDEAGYRPMMVAVILIQLASSDLWRDHLNRSNFTSCEEIVSTKEGRETALERMFYVETYTGSEFHTPAKITATMRRLEELRCLNMAELVISWAWTTGVINPVDREAWELIGRDTLRFYQTHGIGRLTTLSRHITDTSTETAYIHLLIKRYGDAPCRVRRPLVPVPRPWSHPGNRTDLRVSLVCQLRRLYHLLGYDPATWKEAVVVVGEVDETMGACSGRSVSPTQLTDWACDYP